MEKVFLVVEWLVLAWVIGGMGALAFGVRPILMRWLGKESGDVKKRLEELSIRYWNRFNMVGFWGSLYWSCWNFCAL
jgi:hypothetical protein